MHNELTKKDIQMMKEELDYRRIQLRPQLLEAVKEARAFGDLSENSEYDEAKTEQGKLYSKIAEMKVLIENAEIIEKTELDADTVSLSSHVKLRDLDENDEIEYQIVGSQEANPMQGRISDESPIGRAIIGHRVGETVTVEAPAGQMRFTIMSVSNE